MSQPAFCISIDVELAWGFWDRPSAEYFRLCAEKERSTVRRLVALFERFEVSATWAIVGRLLEERGAVPLATSHGSTIWHAPDVVDTICRARVPQDVGSHTYAHLYFGTTSRQALQDDLGHAHAVHARHGLGFDSFVFPRNQVNHADLLAERGIRVFRGSDRGWPATIRARAGTTAGRLANLVDKMTPAAPAAVEPVAHAEGLVELPGSMLLLDRSGLRRAVRPAVTIAKARRGLERACRTGGVFHLWFHPSNFYYQTDVQFDVLAAVLAAASDLRDRGRLAVRPMASFAEMRPGDVSGVDSQGAAGLMAPAAFVGHLRKS